MKSYKLLNQLKWMLLLVLTVTVASCSDDDVSDEVQLEVFGPTPVARGGELTFIGRNLDKVSAVVLPDNIEITDIEVVSSEEIVVTVPQEAAEGKVSLVYSGGTITSTTNLAFIEPIEIETISPLTVKAGETLTIEGEYLNLIHTVTFADGVAVDKANFITWERSKIQLSVPLEAQTGTILLTDSAKVTTTIESEDILQVTLPSVSEVTELTDFKPGDEASIEVTNISLVEKVILANEEEVEFTTSGNTLTFTVPEGSTDGEINVQAYSGVNVPVANITMAVPTTLVASPATGLRPDDGITISGSDLDLVTGVVFPGTSEVVEPTLASGDITVTMPAAAISGDLELQTASGKSVYVAIETLKPAVTAYNPSPITAGEDLTITGTDLDLVSGVTYANGIYVDAVPTSATELTVNVPIDATSGVVTFTMTNGETVSVASLTVNEATYCYVTAWPASGIVAGTLAEIDVVNGENLTEVLVNGVSVQYVVQGSTLHVPFDADAVGSGVLKLVSASGEMTYDIEVLSGETTVYEGSVALSWGDGGRVYVATSSFDNVSAGATLRIYFTQNDNWGQAQINYGDWSQILFDGLSSGYLTTDVVGDKSVTSIDLVLTQEILDNIQAKGGDGSGIIIQGSDWTIDKITVVN